MSSEAPVCCLPSKRFWITSKKCIFLVLYLLRGQHFVASNQAPSNSGSSSVDITKVVFVLVVILFFLLAPYTLLVYPPFLVGVCVYLSLNEFFLVDMLSNGIACPSCLCVLFSLLYRFIATLFLSWGYAWWACTGPASSLSEMWALIRSYLQLFLHAHMWWSSPALAYVF